ncbi:TetR/AcrR family transcriptional regulator [Kitasatospora viridis]|uniref:TetR family transcriptional regulator n=1 Tax=Kitasatospora viridis TaxID=281105 RepID=A0A561UD12_9ACTN|nr:TetR/AcrR family transcriptional regulator [Kitasatospora viridis]TWF97241.1 TetR family transcriptional regulator [Kitasatospora viridis]
MADKPHDPTLSVWLSPPEKKRRGAAPSGLSRERIIEAAVALLDAEGVTAFSMRKLAAGLSVTPMSVYWYVDNKDALLELALDAVIGEIRPQPLEDHGDWHRHLYVLAHEYRRCYLNHPWAAELSGRYLAVGPNAMLFSSSAVHALTRTGLTGDQLGGALALVFQYAYAFALVETQWNRRVKLAGTDEDVLYRQMLGLLSQADPRHQEFEELLGYDREKSIEAARNRQFDQGLEMALAGIEATVDRLPKQD